MKLLMSNRKLESESEKLRIKSEECKFKKVDVETTNLKCERAITLITLVLTIIILIILAGVVINLSIGENGLFSKAKKAREDYMVATNREQQELANIDIDKLIGEQANTWKPEIVSAKDISNKTDKSNYYGSTVTNYTCTNSAGVNAWKIFYADENNIYLIADDYIHYDYCPPSATQKVRKYSDYKLELDNVYKDYLGAHSITDLKIRELNKKYFEYLDANSIIKTRDNENARAMAYMLDTNVWSVFSGEKAEYAVGGPTIELFLASYNQTHSDANFETQIYEDREYGFIGYGFYKKIEADSIIDDKNKIYKNLYVIEDTTKALAVWMASPTDNSYDIWDGLMSVRYDGQVGYMTESCEAGLRPMVCLKSDVQLELQKDGTYKIK